MNRLGMASALLFGLCATFAAADAPTGSLRPMARPTAEALPVAQISDEASALAMMAEPAAEAPRRKGLFGFLRPASRPQRVEKKPRAVAQMRQKGMVCGDPALQGEEVGAVADKLSGCGVADAVRLRSVSGIMLSQQAVMDCGTAGALRSWVDKGMKPAIGQRGGGVAEIEVAAHYVCRGRNNQRGAKISEHGKGRAIDISAFRLRDGSEITVLNGWRDPRDAKMLKTMHKAACGPFGTVLGPGANRFHQDHLHFDTARYRNGHYCK